MSVSAILYILCMLPLINQIAVTYFVSQQNSVLVIRFQTLAILCGLQVQDIKSTRIIMYKYTYFFVSSPDAKQ